MNPAQDLQVLPHRSQGHGPEREHDQDEEDATLLIGKRPANLSITHILCTEEEAELDIWQP